MSNSKKVLNLHALDCMCWREVSMAKYATMRPASKSTIIRWVTQYIKSKYKLKINAKLVTLIINEFLHVYGRCISHCVPVRMKGLGTFFMDDVKGKKKISVWIPGTNKQRVIQPKFKLKFIFERDLYREMMKNLEEYDLCNVYDIIAHNERCRKPHWHKHDHPNGKNL
jgi:nucleoid DNA-binding protein